MNETLKHLMSLSPQKLALHAFNLQKKLQQTAGVERTPIAVIGAGLRMPGGVCDLEGLWQLLESGRDPLGPVPPERWDSATYFRAGAPVPGKTNVNQGGFLPRIDQFDPAFFGISPREAQSMDPQQRLVLECTWEALEHAACAPDRLKERRAGVYMGVAAQDYSRLVAGPGGDLALMDAHFGSGNGNSVIAGRVAFLLGLRGPAVAVDTACSSSLVALHLACQSLRAGETDMALAGGVNVILSPAGHVALSQTGMLAPDGRCKTFDHRADGFVRSEGCGVVVLKRLADAQKDGDRVLGVIEGSAVNQDGRSASLTAPNGPSQEAVMRAALADAGLAPGDVSVLETHGTGTDLGDPIEAQAAAAVYGAGRGADEPLILGALKSVCGHMETAAGIGGLIKILAMLQKGRIPANLHLETPNPKIPWDALPLSLPTTMQDWNVSNAKRRAAVSSFGYSGTNAHVIVAAPPPAPAAPAVGPTGPALLCLSAPTPAGAVQLAGEIADLLEQDHSIDVYDVARSLTRGRAALAARGAIVTDDREEAVRHLRNLPIAEVEPGQGGVIFAFTGQGAQYGAMAGELYAAYPAFRDVIDRCDAIARQSWTFDPSPLVALLTRQEGVPDIDNTAYTQPALFAYELAMAALWRSWGVTPEAVIGHSIGEIAAAACAGAFTLEDGFALAMARGALCAEMPGGAMAMLDMSESDAQALLAEHPGLSIAGVNAPEKLTVAGSPDAIAAMLASGVRGRALAVSHAFHSPAMAAAAERLQKVAALITVAAPSVPLMSSLTCDWAGCETLSDPAHWARHMTEPVRFYEAMCALLEDRPAAVLELGPRPHLAALTREIAQYPVGLAVSARKERPSDVNLAEAVRDLWLAGVVPNWRDVPATQQGRIVSLPNTPYARQRCWLPDSPGQSSPALAGVLGQPIDTPLAARLYDSRVSPQAPAWLGEHRVGGQVWMPGAAIIDAALHAGQDALQTDAVSLRDLVLVRPVALADDGFTHLQWVLLPENDGFTFQLFSRTDDGGHVEHATGRLERAAPLAAHGLDEARHNAPDSVEVEQIFAAQRALNLDLGPSYKGLMAAWAGADSALGQLRAPQNSAAMGGHTVAPPLLDAAFQVLGALPGHDALQVPARIGRVSIASRAVAPAWCAATRRGADRADFTMFDAQGAILLTIEDMHFAPVERANHVADWLYRVVWHEDPAPLADGALPDLAVIKQCAVPEGDDIARYVGFLNRVEDLAATAIHHVLATVDAGQIAPNRQRLWQRFLTIAADHAPSAEAPETLLARLTQDYPEAATETALLGRCARGLSVVLQGGDPLALLFPGGDLAETESVYADTPLGGAIAQMAEQAMAQLIAHIPPGRPLRILEIGAGTGSLTRAVLPQLLPERTEYWYTDISPRFIEHGRGLWGDRANMHFTVYDVESPAADQGIPEGAFDLVLASNVLHATRDLTATMEAVKTLLAPEGAVLLLEATAPRLGADITFGLTDGWWRFNDTNRRPDHPLLSRQGWQDLLCETGFDPAIILPENSALEEHALIAARMPARALLPKGQKLRILGEGPVAAALCDALGPMVVSDETACVDQIVICETVPEGEAPGDVARALCDRALSLILALDKDRAPPALVWITRGGDVANPGIAALAGLLRSARREYPQFTLRHVDIDGDNVNPAPLIQELARSAPELRHRAGRRLLPTLDRARGRTHVGTGPFRVDIAARGSLDGLTFAPLDRVAPGPGEVEIAVSAVGLNFRDVLNCMGLYPGELGAPGEECAGQIVALGEGVQGLEIGDPVVAIAGGCLASHATVPARFVRPRPQGLSMAQAATVPVAYLTAAVALEHLGRIAPGERIVVHAGAGGVGMAAIHMAHRAGARVLATAHPSKWSILKGLGVEAVASSRAPGFGAAVRAWSGGAGADLVLNSLQEPFITESFDMLAPGGRFLEIGRRDIWSEAQARDYRPDVSYHAINVADVVESAPEAIGALYDRVLEAVGQGHLPPLTHHLRPVSQVHDAFGQMQAGRHTGRLVLDLSPTHRPVARRDGTYVITGGLRGLGPEVGRWLAEQGAGRIVLLGRRAADTDGQAAIAAMGELGSTVETARIDVTRSDDLAQLFARLDADGPPVRGILHAAGVLADAPLIGQTGESFAQVLAPKIDAAWTLHNLSLTRPVDMFVLFSAGAAVFGTPGQANHCAANAALDGLAAYRKARDLPALSVNWGPWGDVGAAADDAVKARITAQGMSVMATRDALEALRLALARGEDQIAVLPFDWPRFLDVFAPGQAPALVEPLAARHRQAGAVTVGAPLASSAPSAPERAQATLGITSQTALADLIRRTAAQVLGLGPDAQIAARQALRDLGLDSLMAVDLRNRLARELDLTLPSTLLFDYPSVAALVDHLAPQVLAEPASAPVVPKAPERQPAQDSGAIAIIGIGCRLPGGIDDRAGLWRNLVAGTDGVVPVPSDRWDIDAYYDPDPDAPGKTYARHGGFIDQVDRFDAPFFGISPREAASMDPQQRLMLELSYEALEDAGLNVDALAGAPVGVFLGICGSDYLQLQMADGGALGSDPYLATGNAASVAAGRISYVFGFEGPAIAIDTACSSSLVATHMARKSLASGECDVALAGGVNLMLEPGVAVNFAKSRMLAQDGRCKSFDAKGDGFVRGEGGAVVAMKRLSDALRDGDPVLAVLRGSAVNQDGRSAGLTAPNGPAQEKVIVAALRDAGVDPGDVGFVEAHGSGTSLGDPIEATALGRVMAGRDRPLLIGSIKSSIGHLEGAAGVAGLAKAVLALKYGQVPGNLHFDTPSPHIDWANLPIEVVTSLRPWPGEGKRRIAGVSSFGFSGTNVHLVLENAPTPPAIPGEVATGARLVPVSARDGAALRALSERMAVLFDGVDDQTFARLAAQAGARRAHHTHRQAVVAETGAQAAAGLRAGERTGRCRSGEAPRLAFVFSGQGGQWAGMARDLMAAQPVFRETIEAASRACLAVGGPDVAALLKKGDDITAVDQVQPALFAVQLGLVAVLRAWGVQPEAVAGHSLGEVAAAHVAGALDLADAARVICLRSRALARIAGQGGMMVVGLGPEAAAAAIKTTGGAVDIAVMNGRNSTVLSGAPDALAQVKTDLECDNIFCRMVEVDVASHGRQVDPLRDELMAGLSEIAPQTGTVPFVSSVRAEELAGSDLAADYWWQNLRQPVRFAQTVAEMAARGITHIVEIGPHPVLATAMEDETAALAAPPRVLFAQHRDMGGHAALLSCLAELYVDGFNPHWPAVAPPPQGRIDLPLYPWQRKRHWFEPSGARPLASMAKGPVPPWDMMYETAWRVLPRSADRAIAPTGGDWVVLGQGALADDIAKRVQARRDGALAGAHVICFAEGRSPVDLAALYGAGPRAVWIVTRAGQSVLSGEAADPDQAALWGLGRVALLEHPEIGGGLLDLPPNAVEGADLVQALYANDGEDQIALRGGRRFGPRLARWRARDPLPRPEISADATYLITGGLGGIGVQLAEWLAVLGAGHVMLVGRRGVPDAAVAERLAMLKGCEITCHAGDVSDPNDVNRILRIAHDSGKPLRGIFHAAGTARPARLDDMTDEAYDEIAATKLHATRLLDEKTQTLRLDWFVCFSTGGALWGAEGQGAYAAASAAMDALMTARKARGLPGLSINWGWWAASGLVDETAAAYYAKMGFHPVPGAKALDALSYLMQQGCATAAVAAFDWPLYRSVTEARRPRPLLEEMEVAERATVPTTAEAGALLAGLNATAPERRLDFIKGELAAIVADILALSGPDAVEEDVGFFQMGLDSIMAVRLRQRLEAGMGQSFAPSIAFEFPTIDILANYILDRAAPPPTPDQNEDLFGQVADMDDSAIDALFAQAEKDAS
ncbi:SDR family NAD(P)-dependent oxidoreductase [Roseovarius aestuarii]|nr:SDR family NAD(P)-dependent oxidoreductase [Roseovarius aestuarii]